LRRELLRIVHHARGGLSRMVSLSTVETSLSFFLTMLSILAVVRGSSEPFSNPWRDPGLNLSVNKRDLSTRENGEFGAYEPVFGPDPASTDSELSPGWRDRKTATHAKCFGYERASRASRCCQQNGVGGWKENVWLPENTVFQLSLSTFLNVSGRPAWIRTAPRPRRDPCAERHAHRALPGFILSDSSRCLLLARPKASSTCANAPVQLQAD
jgi:hypothetical protein